MGIVKITLTSDFQLDVSMIKSSLDENEKLYSFVLLVILLGHIKSILEETSGIVVEDEAYIDFCDTDGHSSMAKLIGIYPNLVVSQTLSKSFGLAGLRYP